MITDMVMPEMSGQELLERLYRPTIYWQIAYVESGIGAESA